MDKGTAEWIRCLVCGGKTRDKMRKEQIRNFNFCFSCHVVLSFKLRLLLFLAIPCV